MGAMRPLAAVALLMLAALAAGCSSESVPIDPARAAKPQAHELRWVERYPASGPGLVFRVRSFAVTRDGWEAEIAFDNRSGVHWELPEAQEAFRRMFGVMLFATGELAEVERKSKDGDLPPVRRARTFAPALVAFLPAGETWSGRISAPGALPAGSFARLVFGPFTAAADPPEGMESPVVWITDRVLELEP
jgi:hypothetical protein